MAPINDRGGDSTLLAKTFQHAQTGFYVERGDNEGNLFVFYST